MENKMLDEIIKTAKESGVEVKITNDSDSLNVLDYLGSSDVSEYYKNIKYEFSTFQKAILIANSGNPVTKVLSELKQLLNNGIICERVEELIVRQEKELLTFLKEEKNAFYRIEYSGYRGDLSELNFGLFSSYSRVLEELKSAKDLSKQFYYMTIDKYYMDDEDSRISVWLDDDFQIIETYSESNGFPLRDFAFQHLYEINITLPFKPGDIVVDCRDNPYVMLNTPKWCDSADIVTIREKPDHNGLIDMFSLSNPGDLSFFRGKLIGKYRILKDISDFMRKYPIDIEDLAKLLNKYLRLYTQIEAKRYENY